MRVAFRVDASIDIGTGHVMRCLTLAEELARQGHICSFICRDHKGHLGNLITSKGFELALVADACHTTRIAEVKDNPHSAWLGVPWQDDATHTVEVLKQHDTDWLVVDHYALDARWEQMTARAVGRIMVIDDLADRTHDCSLLLDQNLGRHREDYDGLVPKNTVRLVGPRYALLRPEFRQMREGSLKRRQTPELKRILISLGGVDRTNVTGKVLAALSSTLLPPETKLDIIMGASAPFLKQVQEQIAALPFDVEVSVNVTDMAERMCLADLSIGAAGSTSWERCCLGLPAILVVLAANQQPGANALQGAGAAATIRDPGTVQKDLPENLAKLCLPESLQQMSEAAARIAEGEGTLTVVHSMISINHQSEKAG